jgi:DHA1 family bicyclomycin/chloramphenicol resistance-like MFS transporter
LNKNDTSAAFTILLGLLIGLSALGSDFFVPALPDTAAWFSAPVSATQMTLTTYFLGLALGQLFWGPLSDRYGRKPVLLVALAVMLAASLAAPLAPTIGALSAVRFVQGLAMSAGIVVARSIVRDLHSHERAARLLASAMIVFSLVPLVAPLCGAFLTSYAGWRAIFWGYALVAAGLLVAVAAGLRETAPADRAAASPAAIARTLAGMLGNRAFTGPLGIALCCLAALLTWVTNSSFTLVQGAGVSVRAYGWMFFGVMLGQIVGAWIASRFVMRLGNARLLHGGVRLVLFGGGAAAALAWIGQTHWLALVVPFAVILFGAALVLPSATALALSPFPRSAGAASSLVGALTYISGAVLSALLGALFDGTARPMASAAALAGLGAFALERRLARGAA